MNTAPHLFLISSLTWASVTVSADPGASDQQEERMRIEGQATKKYAIRLEATPHKQYCQASASIEYSQYDDIASVSGTINNEDCAASSGEYTISVRFRDENDQIQNLDFEESWQREDDQPINFEKDYAIGKNVDLIRVRTRRIRCVCAKIEVASEYKE